MRQCSGANGESHSTGRLQVIDLALRECAGMLLETRACGAALEGRQRIVCGSRRCRDARFKRTNPDGYAVPEARKVERRKADS